MTINRVVNAFFRWEFNSCEMLVKFTPDGERDEVYPIDYANACPDVAITSLHYYFPWAMKALAKWTTYALVTDRRHQIDLDTAAYFAIADRDDLDYAEKLARYRKLADDYFEADRYFDWCDSRLRHFDEVALEWFSGPEPRSRHRRDGEGHVPRARAGEVRGALPGAAGAVVPGRGRTDGRGAARPRLRPPRPPLR